MLSKNTAIRSLKGVGQKPVVPVSIEEMNPGGGQVEGAWNPFALIQIQSVQGNHETYTAPGTLKNSSTTRISVVRL